jgi:hypothetical protein
MALVESIGALCPAIGFALGGAVAAIWSPRGTFVMAGAGAALATCAFAILAGRARAEQRLVSAAGGPSP